MTYEEMLREAFRRWNAGDFEGAEEFLHPEIEWHTSGRFPDLEPVYRGLDGVVRFWETFTAPWEEIVLEPRELTVAGDQVIVEGGFRARGRDGIEVELVMFQRYAGRHGKIVLSETYRTRAAAFEAAGIEEPAS
ncbi:MAG TPA: nuclear transport factor 2 family protein [Thermoleophilaceae bacterium]|jgi:ketosteroid isomerase-like protein